MSEVNLWFRTRRQQRAKGQAVPSTKKVHPDIIKVQSSGPRIVDPRRILCPKFKKKNRKSGVRSKVKDLTESHVVRSAVSYYFDFAYNLGICPYKEKLKESNVSTALHKAFYALFAFISFLHAVRVAKTRFLQFLTNKGHVGHLIACGYYFVRGFTLTYFTYLLVTKKKKMLQALDSTATTEPTKISSEQRNKKHKLIAVGIGVATIFLTTIKLLFGFYNFRSWSITEFVELYAYVGRSAVLSWRPGTFQNETRDLLYQYSSSPTSSIVICVAAAIVNFCGWMQDYILQICVLLIAVAMRNYVAKFVNKLDDQEMEFKQKWKMYIDVRRRTSEINEPISFLLLLVHINHAMLLAYFLLDGLDQNKFVDTIILGLKVAKVFYLYYVSAQISEQNMVIRKWLRSSEKEHAGASDLEKKVNTLLILGDATEEPIGLGKNEFFLDQGFVLKFVGAVSTIFMILVESRYD